MANVLVDEAVLQGVADKIREKTGTDAKYKPGAFTSGIDAVYEAGGGAGSGAAGGSIVCGSQGGTTADPTYNEDGTLTVSGLGFEPKEIHVWRFGEAPKDVKCTTQYVWRASAGGSGYNKHSIDSWRIGKGTDFLTVTTDADGFSLTASEDEYYFYGTYIWAAFAEEQATEI